MMITDSELRRRFVMANDDVLAPAPALEARVLDALRREQRQDDALRSGPNADSAMSAAGRCGRSPSWDSHSWQPPKLMAVVAAALAVAVVISLVLTARALHLKSTVPAHPGTHSFVRLWSHTVDPAPAGRGIIAFTRDGFVLVVDHESGSIIKLNASDGHESLRWGTIGSGPGQFKSLMDVAVDAQNNVYATDFQAGKVLKFNAHGRLMHEWSTEPPVGPTGIGVDARDRVYVALNQTHDHHVQVFTSDGQLLAAFGQTGTGPGEFGDFGPFGQFGPLNIVVQPDGSVWVTDADSGRIYDFAGDGRLLLQAGAGTRLISGLHFQNVFRGFDGHVYAEGGGNVHELDPSGHDLGVVDAGALGLPQHEGFYPIPVADFSGDNLYIFDVFDSSLIKFSRR
jgi:streptogramin lyase